MSITKDCLSGPNDHMDKLLFNEIKIPESKNKVIVFMYYKYALFILHDINQQIQDGVYSVLSAHTATITEKKCVIGVCDTVSTLTLWSEI